MEEIKNQLIQTGFNLDRLYQDKKISDMAYTILKDRNKQALIMCDVSQQSQLLKAFGKKVNEIKGYTAVSEELIDAYIKSL